MLDGYLWIAQSPFVWAAIGFWLVLFVLNNVAIPTDRVKPIRFAEHTGLNLLGWFAVLLIPVWVLLLGLVLYSLGRLTLEFDGDLEGESLRWHVLAIVGLITALGGLVGAPLALIRVYTTERQTKTGELGLVNQRIQTALEQLSARYTRTRMGRTVRHGPEDQRDGVLQWHDANPTLPPGTDIHVQDWTPVPFSEPDTQTRLSGIGQLEAVLSEFPERRRMINEHLASFIRANALASSAARFDDDSGEAEG